MAYKNIKERQAWINMIHMCYNPEHRSYEFVGGTGARVHDAWLKRDGGFDAFFAYVGPKPRSDLCFKRIDTTKDFEPGNVLWSVRTRGHSNGGNPYGATGLLVTINDQTKSLAEWARYAGIKPVTIHARHRRGIRGQDLINPEHASLNSKRPERTKGRFLID